MDGSMKEVLGLGPGRVEVLATGLGLGRMEVLLLGLGLGRVVLHWGQPHGWQLCRHSPRRDTQGHLTLVPPGQG